MIDLSNETRQNESEQTAKPKKMTGTQRPKNMEKSPENQLRGGLHINSDSSPSGILGANRLLPERIYERLLEQIAIGRFAHGDRLPSEHALAQILGVSRPTVRIALSRLQADGVIVSRKGSGNYVEERPSPHLVNLKPGSGSIAEMLLGAEFRMAIEGDAAALAAVRRSDIELATLSDVIQRQKLAIDSPLAEVHDADIAFHLLVAEAARNRLFVEAIHQLYSSVMNSWLLWHRMSANEYRQIWQIVLEEHCAVYEAIRLNDPEAARLAMRNHLFMGRQRMLRTNTQQGDQAGLEFGAKEQLAE